MRRLLLLLFLGLAALPAGAQTIVIVAAAGPGRGHRLSRSATGRPAAPQSAMAERFALISETRRVTLPAGETELRFEGVAGGIMPQSAIVTGLPEGIIERNRDAYLLSPATLLDRSLGLRVHLRRTSRATGRCASRTPSSAPAPAARWSSRPKAASRRCAAPACPRR